jgi:hypothetical protein
LRPYGIDSTIRFGPNAVNSHEGGQMSVVRDDSTKSDSNPSQKIVPESASKDGAVPETAKTDEIFPETAEIVPETSKKSEAVPDSATGETKTVT